MEVIILADPDKVCKYAAMIVANQVRKKPNSVLGLASGSTQLGTYRELIRMHQQEGLDFSKTVSFNLDEYIGLPKDHPCAYRSLMAKDLFDHVNIKPENIHIPDGTTDNVDAECERYEQAIRQAGGIDLQLLGLGADGHIGFNEPGSSLSSRTRIKSLTEKTRYDNARFFPAETEVPRHVITMGVGTIMDCRNIILCAFGQAKSKVVAQLVEGPISSMVPGTALQYHPKVRVVLDEPAAEELKLKHYFKWAYDNKPDWQRP